MHILVVEDEQRLAFLLRRVLVEERHAVDLAHDGHAGLDLALSDTYDVVILDVMLPKLDGMEICRQMRAEHIMTPVLMLTARGAVEDRVTGLNVGADDYLTKPFDPGQVLTRTQIVDAVWRYDLEALSNVVDIYIHYLREKIDQGFSHPVIKTVRGVGYKIEA